MQILALYWDVWSNLELVPGLSWAVDSCERTVTLCATSVYVHWQERILTVTVLANTKESGTLNTALWVANACKYDSDARKESKLFLQRNHPRIKLDLFVMELLLKPSLLVTSWNFTVWGKMLLGQQGKCLISVRCFKEFYICGNNCVATLKFFSSMWPCLYE